MRLLIGHQRHKSLVLPHLDLATSSRPPLSTPSITPDRADPVLGA
jgi:hypothetical protein